MTKMTQRNITNKKSSSFADGHGSGRLLVCYAEALKEESRRTRLSDRAGNLSAEIADKCRRFLFLRTQHLDGNRHEVGLVCRRKRAGLGTLPFFSLREDRAGLVVTIIIQRSHLFC